MRNSTQKWRDHNRKTYLVSHPYLLEAEKLTAWVRSISGTLKANKGALSASPSVAFELWSTPAGIQHRLKVPWQHADYVISQLRSLVPGIRVTPEESLPRKHWTRAIEARLTNPGRQLRIYDAAATSASLLAAVQPLDPDETVLVQWVVTPAVPTAMPVYKEAQTANFAPGQRLMHGNMAGRDEVNDRRGKLEEPNVLGSLRIAAVAESVVRADHLIYRVKASLASTRSASTRFKRRMITHESVRRRIDNAVTPVVSPIQLSAPELAALIAWPIGNPFVSGLPPALSRQLPVPQTVALVGRILGRSNMPGHERDVALAYDDARKHSHILGPSGSGKSVLLANMIKQDVEAGYGVILIENKGDLFRAVMNYVPPDRMQDVIVLDVTDSQWPVGFNVLNQGNPRNVVDELCALFEHLYSDTHGVWTREVLYHGLLTIANDPKLAFTDLATLLMPMTRQETDWADELRRGSGKELRQFWQRFENQDRKAQDRIVQPVMDRIWQLTARPELRNIIGQSESSFQMEDVIRNHQILLVNLENVPKETASLAGTLLMSALWRAVRANPTPDKPNFLYLDEFQDFINMPIDPEDMLAKARSFGLGMTLAHQHLGQLPTSMRQAVLTNARTKLVFQTSAGDAKIMATEFGSSVDEHDFQHLGQYEAVSRVAVGGNVCAPFTLTTNPPAHGFGKAHEIRDMSRGRYGRSLHDVTDQIANRTTNAKPKTASQRKPSVGFEGNDPWSRP